jgi:superfamily II DNA or RNA helicase
MATPSIPSGLNSELWPHQRKAVHFALQYLREPYKAPVGLIRMPTGTGKTGVIATLTAALPQTGWTLILTPWRNLCKQMQDDIKERFWETIEWKPSSKPNVERLYPRTINSILARETHGLIVVATFATLVTIFKKNRDKYNKLATKIAQVFVDEGHYEPAAEWGQAVKQLHKPTVLLTATPYRNDLKLFRISQENVHHFTHKDAEENEIIRGVDFKSLGVPQPNSRELEQWCNAFAEFWDRPDKARLCENPRAIICCSTMQMVARVTSLLRERHRINAVGIHERFGKMKGEKKEWLKQRTPEPKDPDIGFDVWVHQNKLTEGIDDSRFCVLAILNSIRNDRKLIQQIGRVLRRGKKKVGRALVLHSEGLAIEKSWRNYREFEIQPDFVVSERYRAILDTLLNEQPTMEYFGGRFRRRFESRSTDLKDHILLRASTVIRRVTASFELAEFIDYTSDFLLMEDRILLGPTEDCIKGPDGSMLWVYALFSNSPLLVEHSQYEIRLGALAAIKHDNLLFAVDTEGLYPSEYLAAHTKKLGMDELGRILGRASVQKEVSITNAWPAGPAVQRSTIRAEDLANTPAQLTDAVFVCASVRTTSLPENANLPPRRQYVGFKRGRVTEQIQNVEREAFGLEEFAIWTNGLAELIQNTRRKLPDFFSRYLSPVAPPDKVSPRFLVFNYFEGDIELRDDSGDQLELVDTIIEIEEGEEGDKGDFRFPFTLRYRNVNTEADAETLEIDAALVYEPAKARFRLNGEELNSEIFVFDPNTGEGQGGLPSYLNNNDEFFTIALRDADVYYSAQSFYRIDYTYAEDRLSGLITSVPALAKAASEKGQAGPNKASWDTDSLFSIIANTSAAGLIGRQFGPCDWIFCDDLNKEVADFICANFETRKIAFIHAKHGDGHIVSASAMQEVVAQALKNLGVTSRGGTMPAHLNRWTRESMWDGTKIPRWQKGAKSLPEKNELWKMIRDEILDHPHGIKEVWLVAGDTLNRSAFVEQLHDEKKRDAVTGQLVHLLSSLHASCTQLAITLKIFCN